MKYIYEFGVRLPLGKLLDPVKELETSIGTHLAEMGYQGMKPSITYLHKGTVEVDREMTENEITMMKTVIESTFAERFASAKIEYFRRQSGNVQQSAP